MGCMRQRAFSSSRLVEMPADLRPAGRTDLVLRNARAITLDDSRPSADLVAIAGDRIVWVGSEQDMAPRARPASRVIDCQGQTLVPGFIDAHCHVMAYASSLLSVDCSPTAVESIPDVLRALGERARSTPPGEWVRATGFDELAVVDRRFPSRWELDEALPDHPVRLNHRSGHACVLNTVALTAVGISIETPDPADGVIDRDLDTGEPSGLLMEMDDYLDGRIPPLRENELRRGVQQVGRRMARLGITSLQDAGHTNSTKRWDAFKKAKAGGDLSPRVTMMAGSKFLPGFVGRGLRFGSGGHDLNLGAVKIMLTMTTGTLRPTKEELHHAVCLAREAGFQVAVHAVEVEAVEAAAEALKQGPRPRQTARPRARDRIEHCSECSDDTIRRLTDAGVAVVTQPGFLFYSGRRYLNEVAEHVRPWLYRLNGFVRAGLRPAAGSDSPVIDPDPLVGIYAAVTRRAQTGEAVGESEGISAEDALRMYTLNGAYASHQEADKGSIEVGKLADLALLDGDPTAVAAERIRDIQVTMTMVGGQIVWQE